MFKAICAFTLAATVLTAGLAHAAKEAPKTAAKPEVKPAASAPATKLATVSHAVAKHSKKTAHLKPASAKAVTEKQEAAAHSIPEKK